MVAWTAMLRVHYLSHYLSMHSRIDRTGTCSVEQSIWRLSRLETKQGLCCLHEIHRLSPDMAHLTCPCFFCIIFFFPYFPCQFFFHMSLSTFDYHFDYRKNPKNSDTRKIAVIILKVELEVAKPLSIACQRYRQNSKL